MYVYKTVRERHDLSIYIVGYYDPDGKWFPEKDCESQEDAAYRVHWLNGGN